MIAHYFWEALAVLLVAPPLLRWLFGWTLDRRYRTEMQVYAQVGTTRLYWYQEDWNCSGHRVARQDWWAEVIEARPGQFQRVGSWFKYNVGYGTPQAGTPFDPWCHPFRPATPADILANKEHAEAYWQSRPARRLGQWLNLSGVRHDHPKNRNC